jgi:hypothetical protein
MDHGQGATADKQASGRVLGNEPGLGPTPPVSVPLQSLREANRMSNETALPYDPDNPPYRPPAECTDQLMWLVAWHLFNDHGPVVGGQCAACRPYRFHPCTRRQLASVGLAAACGHLAAVGWAPMSAVRGQGHA